MTTMIKNNSEVLAAIVRSAREYFIGPPQPAKLDLAMLERRLALRQLGLTLQTDTRVTAAVTDRPHREARSHTRTLQSIFLAILLGLSASIVWAGQARTSFGVTVRVLPHCDASRHGGIIERPDGTARCVYPRISEAQSTAELPVPLPVATNDSADMTGVTVRTITY